MPKKNLKQLSKSTLSVISFEPYRKQRKLAKILDRKLAKILDREFRVVTVLLLRVIANMLFTLITHSMRTFPAVIVRNMNAVDQRSRVFLQAHGVTSETDGYKDSAITKVN
jgi:hypothetical protein